MTLCERCGNYPNICGCAEADALEAQLADVRENLSVVIGAIESGSVKFALSRIVELIDGATDSASGVTP